MLFEDIRSVLQPRYCLHCGVPLLAHQLYLCLNCTAHLEETSFHLSPANPLWQALRLRCPIEGATSLFFFGKRNVAQDLIHHLKYKGKQEIGEWLGKWLGSYIATAAPFSSAEVLLPVPLHPRKLRLRGYNQVARFGQSLARTMQIAYTDDLLIKTDAVGTQTRKFVWKRFNENDHIFALRNPERWIGKHLLLVDDVITTGSTLERCYTALSSIPEVKISVASIACAVIK